VDRSVFPGAEPPDPPWLWLLSVAFAEGEAPDCPWLWLLPVAFVAAGPRTAP
jgi:hypothetical protein